MNISDPLEGKVVCIAGASRGIGKTIAAEMARRSAKLLLLARSPELERTAAELGAETEVIAVRTNIANMSEVRPAIEQALTHWGRVDVLVNCAAVLGATGELWTTDPDQWREALEVNLLGTYNLMRAVLPSMIAARHGRIINFAGGGAAYGYPKFSAYGSSKAAIVRLTETVALECEGYNVQVNAIAPGAIETELLAAVRAAGGEVRTVGSMDLAVQLVMHLASPISGGLTGRFIHARDSYMEWPDNLAQDHFKLRRIPS